jgi:hypothetical protein
MSQTIFNTSNQNRSLESNIVIQVTKKQLIAFCQFIVILGMLTLNILAIKIASPFLKELFVSQAILLLVFFVKNNATSNTIIKK